MYIYDLAFYALKSCETIHFSFMYLIHCLFYLHALFLTSLPNKNTVSEGILEWFWISGSYGYICLPQSQCEAMLQLVLMIYMHPVHQEPFQAAAYKSWTLHQHWLVEPLDMAFRASPNLFLHEKHLLTYFGG